MKKGLTLIELMVAVAVMSIGILGLVGSFRYLNLGIHTAKGRSLANNLAQEKIELLKNRSYYRVLATTATLEDANFSPSLRYDAAPNGVETVDVGGINFERRVYIRKVAEATGGGLSYLDWDDPDPGLKEILVYVVWREGGTWKKIELRNLRENPDRISLSAAFSGNVKSSGVDLEGATVKTQENPARAGVTGAVGNYSFAVEPGSYTLVASKTGYFSGTSPLLSVAANNTVTRDFVLTRMSSGTITGTVYVKDHLVISQVVGSSSNVSGQSQEWVEVHNPTTWTWTMASGLGTGANELVYFTYKEAAETQLVPDLDYRGVSLPPGAYFLFANTGTITAAGIVRSADAVYSSDGIWGNIDDVIKTGNPSSAGYVALRAAPAAQVLDKIGWNATGNTNALKTLAEDYEGAPIAQTVGFEVNEAYTRKTSAAGVSDGNGRCYDSNNNNDDFEGTVPLARAPRNSTVTEPCQSGTPGAGAIVFADDGLSTPVTAGAAGTFSLASVATGYWTVYASSGLAYSSVAYYGGTTDGYTASIGVVTLSTAATFGYASGRVATLANAPLDDILIHSAMAVQNVRTDSQGNYLLPILPSTAAVYANYQTDNSLYIEASSGNVVTALGQLTKNLDFALSEGGKLSGWVTTNGADALPDIPVIAFKGGVSQKEGVSGSDGYFEITRLSTGTYLVEPQLDTGESASPSTFTVTLTAGASLFVGTFTVSGAMGYISGTVSAGGAPVTTGVLVYATTTTITSGPPAINSALRDGVNVYYAVSSNAAGVYSLPVRGGYTYNIYAWYTSWSGETPSTARREYTGVAVSAGQTATRNFSW
ncbi:MAG: carboxypeptidase regulatory-like domain-containing protein [Elusimicrobiota bacterium]